jgi:hypothetical protein
LDARENPKTWQVPKGKKMAGSLLSESFWYADMAEKNAEGTHPGCGST